MRIVHNHLNRLLCAVLTAAVIVGSLASAAAGSGTGQHRRARCSQVNFKANSDDIAFHITAVGVTCSTSRDVVDGSAPDRLRPGPNRAYRTGTFSCHGTFEKPVGKWYEHYVCRSARATIEFDRG